MDIWIKYLVNSLLIKDMIVLTVWQQQLPGIWLPLQAFVRCNVEKNNRHHHKICNGFTGYKGTCIGFNGNCNGPCWSLLVIVQLTLNKIINATLFCFCPHFSWAELKDLRLFLCTQKAYFSPILFTNLSKTVSHHSHFYICLNVFWDCLLRERYLRCFLWIWSLWGSLLFGTAATSV